MTIFEEEAPCIVPMITRGKLNTALLFSMQLKKGLKNRDETYLVHSRKKKMLLLKGL